MRNAAAAALVFVGGFIIMVLEIVGARFLAKDFGSSFHVWVSQIGVVLVALALGYYLGGALADRWQRVWLIGALLAPAGIALLLIPNGAEWLIDAIITRHPADQPIPALWRKLDPVLGSALVFLMPCVVLASLSPCMIRLATPSLAQVGRSSGFIIAASTVGSIAGVFVSGFVLIDQMKLSTIFRLMGALTLLLGLLCVALDRWFSRAEIQGLKVRNQTTKLLVLLIGLLCVSYSALAAVVFETTSPYHHIRVVDAGGVRTLYFDDAMETSMSLQDPLKGHFEYTEYFHMPWLWNTNIGTVLMIGLGGGSAQRSFAHYYPWVKIETVEIDPDVVQVARDYFQFKESDRQKVRIEDGRMFLRRSTARYDLVILDAYVQGRYGSAIPQHLATKEFFELVRDHLTTNGVVAYNVIGTVNDWRAEIVGAIYRTLKTALPQVYVFTAEGSRNVVLVATRVAGRAEVNGLRARAALLVQTGRITLPGFRTRLERFRAVAPLNATRSPVLTDDYAPVEGLAAGAGK